MHPADAAAAVAAADIILLAAMYLLLHIFAAHPDQSFQLPQSLTEFVASSGFLSIACPGLLLLLSCREADASTSLSSFKPAAAGTKFAYQFVPKQKNALYPQLASATPFVASDVDITAIVYNKDPSKGPVFQPPKNDYAKTYELGAKNSKTRKQYDTGRGLA